jgi:hypothetical protein
MPENMSGFVKTKRRKQVKAKRIAVPAHLRDRDPVRPVTRTQLRSAKPSLGRGDERDILYNPDQDPMVRAEQSAGRRATRRANQSAIAKQFNEEAIAAGRKAVAAKIVVADEKTVARSRVGGIRFEEGDTGERSAAPPVEEVRTPKQKTKKGLRFPGLEPEPELEPEPSPRVAKQAAVAKKTVRSTKAAESSGLGEAQIKEGKLEVDLPPPEVEKAVPAIAGPVAKAAKALPRRLPATPREVGQYYDFKFRALRRRILARRKNGRGFIRLDEEMAARRDSLQEVLDSGKGINYEKIVEVLDGDLALFRQKETELETSLMYATKDWSEISRLLDDDTKPVPPNLHLAVSRTYVSQSDKDNSGIGQEYRLAGVNGVQWVLHVHYSNAGKLKDVHLKTQAEAGKSAAGIVVHHTLATVKAKLTALGVKYENPTLRTGRVTYAGGFLSEAEFNEYSKSGKLPTARDRDIRSR